ncbi:MAG: UDP-3-O-(3-hydroxymyristoyl)glucosamine N-acyltransferase [Victivallaceae bacterium]|nr:UDP-3-O-(3-hydroxymyristoyl)glucosamine N-acyltransferase [Victivallaceae bacterium]
MKSLSARQIAEMVKGEVLGNPEQTVERVSSLKDAGADCCSFVGNKKYEHLLAATAAGIVLICRDLADQPLNNRTFIVCQNCDLAFGKVIEYFAMPRPASPVGVHPSAVVHPGVKLGKNVSIGPCAVLEEGVEVGDDTVIGAGCYIGNDVKIGAGCRLWPNVTVNYRCIVGNKVILNSGVVIGCDGFGFLPTAEGIVKVSQTGIVQIDDDVEIGANSTVDRARFGKTWIKRNVKIDNLVMVAHNVVVGQSCILVAQCGIAGSAELEQGVIIAAQAGVNGHITVGAGTQLAGTSSLAKSCPPNSIMLGTPAEPQREFMSRYTTPKKVERLKEKVAELEKKIAELEKK